ncbi:MAG: hypothetical protein WC565_02120 [Parcubacteria group bacterium]
MAIRTALENLVAACRAGNITVRGDVERFKKALEDAEDVLETCKTVPCLPLPDCIDEPLATMPDATVLFGGIDEG